MKFLIKTLMQQFRQRNNDDDNKNSTMEQNVDEENEDMDLILMIKNMVLEEKLRDKNTIKQYHDEITFLRNEISEKNDTIKSLLKLLNRTKHQNVETTQKDTCSINEKHDENNDANHRVIINDDLECNLHDVNVTVFRRNYNKNNTTGNDDVSRRSINSDMVNSTISSESLDVTDNNSTLHSSEFNDDELFEELYHEYVLFTKRQAADNRTNIDLYAIRRNKHNNYLHEKNTKLSVKLSNDSNK